MKTPSKLSSLAQPMQRLRFAALASAALTFCGTVVAFDPNATCPGTTNALSRFPVTVDGRFTPNSVIGVGLAAAAPVGGPQIDEWSDIVPQVFTSDAAGNLLRTCPGDPDATSYVYTSLDTGVDDIYLMYDFVGAHNAPSTFSFGETIAQVKFAVHLPAGNSEGGVIFGGNPPGQNTPIVVRFVAGGILGVAASAPALGDGGPSQVNVVFDIDLPGGQTNLPGFLIGLEGAVSFGSSPNSPLDHLQAELGVVLRIPVNFGTPGGPLPGNGINPATGQYDPAPKFWGSGFNDPTGGIGLATRALAAPVPLNTFHAASANIVTINPNGSVTVNSGADAGVGFVPFAATNARKMALAKIKALRAAATDVRVQRRLDDIIRDVTAAGYGPFYLDGARLAPRGGSHVFEIDEDTLEDLRALIRSVPGTPLATALQTCLDLLVGIDGEFARVAIQDAIAAKKDPKVIAEALSDLVNGDKAAVANKSTSALENYEDAWSDATRTRSRGDDHDRH